MPSPLSAAGLAPSAGDVLTPTRAQRLRSSSEGGSGERVPRGGLRVRIRGMESRARSSGKIGGIEAAGAGSAADGLARSSLELDRFSEAGDPPSPSDQSPKGRGARLPTTPLPRCPSVSTTASGESNESEVDNSSGSDLSPSATPSTTPASGSEELRRQPWQKSPEHRRETNFRSRDRQQEDSAARAAAVPVTTSNIRVGLQVLRTTLRPGDAGVDETGTILGFADGTATVHWHHSGIVCDRLRIGVAGDLRLAPDASAAPSGLASPGGAQLRRSSQGLFARREQTCILIDWDDTLFPTSHIRNYSAMSRAQVMECHAAAVELLRLAHSLGRVIIVTLAQNGWVNQCCNKYFPQLGRLIRESSIKVVHARVGEADSLRSYADMKTQAISSELAEFYTQYDGQTWKNVISIGDSDFEREGTRRATDAYLTGPASARPAGHAVSVRTKTFKMVEHPCIEELTLQLSLLHKWMHRIVALDSSLDLELRDARNPADARRVEMALRAAAEDPVSSSPSGAGAGAVSSSWSLGRSGGPGSPAARRKLSSVASAPSSTNSLPSALQAAAGTAQASSGGAGLSRPSSSSRLSRVRRSTWTGPSTPLAGSASSSALRSVATAPPAPLSRSGLLDTPLATRDITGGLRQPWASRGS
eukprot:TRINITY_DN23738_c0_g1_i2.p1 TRINITY_DN23738_c0_g1~~TRINITY_DN23738_c0_g1_i2.p1  ORF type:complete len:646 (+),score=123.61 TRINITY_DN23738_c0_g1_i2:114-2051(+)